MYAHDSNLLDAVVAAVRETGRLLTDPAAVQEIHAKSATDYVTNVDLRVEEALQARLAELTPEAQFMGEEQDNAGLDLTKPCWILDPVDGTTNLIHRFSFSAISLALAEEGRVVFGVVYNPYHDECFTAQLGRGQLPERPPHPGQRRCRAAGEPGFRGHRAGPPGLGRRHLPADAPPV